MGQALGNLPHPNPRRSLGDSFRFSGSKRVLGVKITTAGTIEPDRFNATYDSRFDSGTFTLKRPGP